MICKVVYILTSQRSVIAYIHKASDCVVDDMNFNELANLAGKGDPTCHHPLFCDTAIVFLLEISSEMLIYVITTTPGPFFQTPTLMMRSNNNT
jgi:hypothetical protein